MVLVHRLPQTGKQPLLDIAARMLPTSLKEIRSTGGFKHPRSRLSVLMEQALVVP